MLKKKSDRIIMILLFLFSCSIYAQTYDWIQTIRPGGNEHCWDIANDNNGNVLVTGRVKSTSIFGSGSNTSSPPYKSCCETDVFVAKYRSNGDLVWVSRDGGVQPDWGRAITSDKNGNVFITGEFSDTAFFGSQQVIAVGSSQNRNIFIAKYDTTGACLWAKSAGNATTHSRGYGVTTDTLGNSYITGHISGVANFDGITFGIAGKNIPFVAKFSPSGSCIWAKNIVVQYNGEGNNIKMGPDGNLVVVGGFKGALTVNSVNYPGNSPSWADVFIIEMDMAGNFLWTQTAIGAFQDQANAVDFDYKNDIYIAGTFANDLSFGGVTINSLGASTTAATANSRADGFVAKYTKNGTFCWVKTIRNSVDGLLNDLTIGTLDVTQSHKILVGGSAWGNVDLDGLPVVLDTFYEGGLLAAFDTSGVLLWYKITGGVDGSHFNVRGVSSDQYNNYYVAGGFTGISSSNYTMHFDSITTSSLNGFDGLIAKITPPITSIVSASDTLVCPGQSCSFNVLPEDGAPVSYQWYFPGGTPPNSNLLNPVVSYSMAGNYDAMLVIANGHITDTTSISISVNPAACSTDMIENYGQNTFVKISPNPASNSFVVALDGLDVNKNDVFFQMYNSLGQKINLQAKIANRSFVVNLDFVTSGTYFLAIIQDNTIIKTGKIIVLK